MLQVWES